MKINKIAKYKFNTGHINFINLSEAYKYGCYYCNLNKEYVIYFNKKEAVSLIIIDFNTSVIMQILKIKNNIKDFLNEKEALVIDSCFYYKDTKVYMCKILKQKHIVLLPEILIKHMEVVI